MDNQIQSIIRIHIILILLTMFFTYRLMNNLSAQEDDFGEKIRKYPGINLKEF